MKYKIYIAHSRDERFNYKEALYLPIQQRYETHDIIVPHGDKLGIDSEQLLPTCHLMIAEVSYPSTGLGMELIWAISAKTPVLCIHRKEKFPSSSITNKFQHIIQYESEDDMVEKIGYWIEENSERLNSIDLLRNIHQTSSCENLTTSRSRSIFSRPEEEDTAKRNSDSKKTYKTKF